MDVAAMSHVQTEQLSFFKQISFLNYLNNYVIVNLDNVFQKHSNKTCLTWYLTMYIKKNGFAI